MDNYLKIKPNSVFNIDCIQYLNLLMENYPNKKIFDSVITDIPYDVVSRESAGIRVFDKKEADVLTFDLNKFITNLVHLVKNNILIFCSSEQVSDIYNLLNSFNYHVKLGIWEKTNPSPVNGQHFWLSGVECCVIGSKKEIDDKDLIWRFPSGRSKEHPTEKPSKLLNYLVQTFTNENDLVLDPCAGSGAHLLACKENNRNYIGTELEKIYYELIKDKGL